VSEVKTGDHVRIVLEGEVQASAGDFLLVGGNRILATATHVVSIERMIAPLKVGDKLNPADLRDLPFKRGTVVKDVGDDETFYIAAGGKHWVGCWNHGTGYGYSASDMALGAIFEVVYLP
jgi:hypothetical protein